MRCWTILGILRILFTSDNSVPKVAYSIIHVCQLSMIYLVNVNHSTKNISKVWCEYNQCPFMVFRHLPRSAPFEQASARRASSSCTAWTSPSQTAPWSSAATKASLGSFPKPTKSTVRQAKCAHLIAFGQVK